jgi:hypothetical protein
MEIPRSLVSHVEAACSSHFPKKQTFLERGRQFLCEGEITGRAAFGLETCSDKYSAGCTHEPVYGEPRPLVKTATGEEERGGEMGEMVQMPKVAAAILASIC